MSSINASCQLEQEKREGSDAVAPARTAFLQIWLEMNKAVTWAAHIGDVRAFRYHLHSSPTLPTREWWGKTLTVTIIIQATRAHAKLFIWLARACRQQVSAQNNQQLITGDEQGSSSFQGDALLILFIFFLSWSDVCITVTSLYYLVLRSFWLACGIYYPSNLV